MLVKKKKVLIPFSCSSYHRCHYSTLMILELSHLWSCDSTSLVADVAAEGRDMSRNREPVSALFSLASSPSISSHSLSLKEAQEVVDAGMMFRLACQSPIVF